MKMLLIVLTLVMAGVFGAQAETLIDFASDGAQVSVVAGSAKYRKDAPESQLNPSAMGLVVRSNSEYESGPARWMVLGINKSLGMKHDFNDSTFRIVLLAPPSGRFASNLAVNLRDRDGEIFQLPLCGEGYNENGEYCIDFDVRKYPKGKKGWGSAKANGVLDAPLGLDSIAVHYRSGVDELGTVGGGEMTMVRVERTERKGEWVSDGVAAPREVISYEPISTDVMQPGAEPFPGARELRFKVEPAVTGKMKLTLSHGSRGTAKEGVMTTYEAMASNGVVRFKVQLPYDEMYEFFKLEALGTPAVKVVNAGGEFAQTVAEAMRMRVETGNPLHIVRDGKDERPKIVIRNPSTREIGWKTEITLSDYFGNEVKIPFARQMKPKDEVAVGVPWPLPGRGLWRVKAQVEGDDGSRTEKTDRFAWIDLHEVTAKMEKPKFRMGIHYHGTRYLPDKVDNTIAALVAAGAKFVRCDYDHMWADIEPQQGVEKWEKSDLMIEKLTAAGLALDIIFAGPPSWAIEPASIERARNMKKAGYRVKSCNYLPRKGLFKAFCEKYARRYGTKIDYYECGNEWDLTGTGTVELSDLLKVQQEAYDGLHAGCKDVCVTPNGWTTAISCSNGNLKVWNNGLVEYFAEHPEAYDAWALHCHGTPESFMVNISQRFLPMRASKPLKDRPWLLNETALSCVNGMEDEVASAVWQKIVYGWAAGASDYIWYNLMATGWFDGGEPGYGLITSDFRPRAGYAAFSALSATLLGMDFDQTLYSKGLRHLFRFRGSSKAVKNGMALVGWDTRQVCRIELMTDAKGAEIRDLMGNRKKTEMEDVGNGMKKVVFAFGHRPQALLLEGATKAEVVDKSALERDEVVAILIHGESKCPNAILGTAANVKDLYEANPVMVHRLWKGKFDHSARIWFVPAKGGFKVKALVQDDISAEGDAMDIVVSEKSERKFRVKPQSRQNTTDFYEQFVSTDQVEVGIELIIHDDDGEGEDSYLFLTKEGAGPLKVRFE